MTTNKKLLYGLLAVAVAVLAIGLFVLLELTATPTTEGTIVVNNSGGAGALAAESLNESYITEKADYIIEGTVEKVESRLFDEEGYWYIEGTVEKVESRLYPYGERYWRILTYTNLKIENYIKGAPFTEDKLQIVTPGGRVGKFGESVEDQPIFHEGKKVRIYFREENGEFSIVCGYYGVKEI